MKKKMPFAAYVLQPPLSILTPMYTPLDAFTAPILTSTAISTSVLVVKKKYHDTDIVLKKKVIHIRY